MNDTEQAIDKLADAMWKITTLLLTPENEVLVKQPRRLIEEARQLIQKRPAA
jgi:hypothetical protein